MIFNWHSKKEIKEKLLEIKKDLKNYNIGLANDHINDLNKYVYEIETTTLKKEPYVEIQTNVIRIVAEKLGLRESGIQLKDDIVRDLGADSLDKVEIGMAIEYEFNISSIPDEAFSTIHTIKDAIKYVKDNL